ncbi:flavodoxin-dependent (E)-4-hydroxy-3-methylbut-2-enyl-diphosphate synthase, partial [Salmonella enterica subsp. enterica serovar Kentucky]|nr:flavodoxin-dependent (E)-4-hydroxy-3-methylbut-2-enyl-diphosphate synthase [Salmonella enterica subsp. enterica serovar Kentucky]
VRVSVPTMDAAEAFKLIKQQVNVPLVADIHFDYRIALKVAEYSSKVQIYLKCVSHLPDMCVKWLADKKRIVTYAHSYFGNLWHF